jgi:dethiobiotin synthetase
VAPGWATAWPTRRSALRGLFVTGTDTGAGKTVVAGAVCAALAARGERVAALKPALTGLDDAPGSWPRDHELLAYAASAGQSPEEVAPWRLGAPASPHLAAELSGVELEPRAMTNAARALGDGADAVVCEGVGGLLVPLRGRYLVRDLAVELGLPVLVAARTGLGTINHTLLTVEAARAGGLRVIGVVMTPWPESPSPVERSNRATVERLARVSVAGLPPTDPDSLGAAGAALPLDDWLGSPPTATRAA